MAESMNLTMFQQVSSPSSYGKSPSSYGKTAQKPPRLTVNPPRLTVVFLIFTVRRGGKVYLNFELMWKMIFSCFLDPSI